MSHRRRSGRVSGRVLLLLVLLFGVGTWNYHRNWQIEQETERLRPYAAYARDDLVALRDAYASELTGARDRFDRARRERVRPQGDAGSIAENIDQFAETTRASRRIRDAAAGVVDREGQIVELDREIELRDRFGTGLMRHVKRLTTI
jgi:hypothetical protein